MQEESFPQLSRKPTSQLDDLLDPAGVTNTQWPYHHKSKPRCTSSGVMLLCAVRNRSSNAFTLGCHRNQYRGRRSTSCSQPIEDISRIADGVMKAEVIATAGAPFGLTEYWVERRYVNH